MWCTDKINVTKLDETIKVKGCLGGIPKKLKKVTKAKTKNIPTKSPCQKSRVRPICGVSPRQAVVSPRKAVMLKNAWQAYQEGDNKENSAPVTVHHLKKPLPAIPVKEKTTLSQDQLKGKNYYFIGLVILKDLFYFPINLTLNEKACEFNISKKYKSHCYIYY